MDIHLLQNQQQPYVFKMDQQYLNSLSQFKTNLIGTAISQSFLLLYLLIFLLYSFSAQLVEYPNLKLYLRFASLISVPAIVLWISRYIMTHNIVHNLRLAYRLNHTTTHMRQPGVDYNQFDNLVSQTYNAQNPHIQGVNKAQQYFIRDQIFVNYYWMNGYVGSFHVLARYGLICLSLMNHIYLLSVPIQNSDLRTNLYIYTNIQIIIFLEELIIVVVVILSPLLCLFALLIVIYEQIKEYRNQIKLKLSGERYDSASPKFADSTECAICYLGYGEGQDVCKLGCPGGHVFHLECINQWVKVQRTCPVCRWNILQGN